MYMYIHRVKRNELFSSDRQPGSVARVFAAGLCATSTGGVRPDVACLDTQADRRVRAGGMCPRLMSVCAMWRRVVSVYVVSLTGYFGFLS